MCAKESLRRDLAELRALAEEIEAALGDLPVLPADVVVAARGRLALAMAELSMAGEVLGAEVDVVADGGG